MAHSEPRKIRCDNGPENISDALCCWAKTRGIQFDYIQPGKSQQNAYVECYNRTVRHEWLEINEFAIIKEAQLTATQWLWIYSNEHPSMTLGSITPSMKLTEAFKLKPSTASSC